MTEQGKTTTITITSTTSTSSMTTTTMVSYTEHYLFIIPYDMKILENKIVSGTAVQFSDSCNPDFADFNGKNCTEYANQCDWSTKTLVAFALKNADSLYETGLKCPQRSCGSNSATNLNDAEEPIEQTTTTTYYW